MKEDIEIYLRRTSGIVNGSRNEDSSFAINGDSSRVIRHRGFNTSKNPRTTQQKNDHHITHPKLVQAPHEPEMKKKNTVFGCCLQQSNELSVILAFPVFSLTQLQTLFYSSFELKERREDKQIGKQLAVLLPCPLFTFSFSSFLSWGEKNGGESFELSHCSCNKCCQCCQRCQCGEF